MPEGTARAEVTKMRRAAILDAALRCFDERGLVATTMEDIRVAADVSVGSLYHHFGSKEAIAAALYVSLIEAYQTAAEDAVPLDAEPDTWIRAAIGHHIGWSISNPAATRFLLAHREPEVRRLSRREVQELNRRLEPRVRRWLQDQVARGTIRDLPLEIFLSIVVGPAHAFVRTWAAGAATEPSRAIELLSEAASRAVKTQAGRATPAPKRGRRSPTSGARRDSA